MKTKEPLSYRGKYLLLAVMPVYFMIAGLFCQPVDEIFSGLIAILREPGRRRRTEVQRSRHETKIFRNPVRLIVSCRICHSRLSDGGRSVEYLSSEPRSFCYGNGRQIVGVSVIFRTIIRIDVIGISITVHAVVRILVIVHRLIAIIAGSLKIDFSFQGCRAQIAVYLRHHISDKVFIPELFDGRLDSEKAIASYYREYYYGKDAEERYPVNVESVRTDIVELLSDNRKFASKTKNVFLKQAFQTAGENFSLIESKPRMEAGGCDSLFHLHSRHGQYALFHSSADVSDGDDACGDQPR